jgi:2-oxo-4-hydroxy-4-carboxy-5-ureidoimidazoline decarboxylase
MTTASTVDRVFFFHCWYLRFLWRLDVWRLGFNRARMPSLSHLNSEDRAAFVAAIGHLFEHSPWVAEETWARRPFRDSAHLYAELCATMRRAPHDRQLTLIRVHPDLAGRLAQQNKLTADSTREQASAGLDQLTPAELAEFQQLNDTYRTRFGFPFVICARLNQKSAILAAMRTRLNNAPAVEFDTALAEIEKIAKLRLETVLQS